MAFSTHGGQARSGPDRRDPRGSRRRREQTTGSLHRPVAFVTNLGARARFGDARRDAGALGRSAVPPRRPRRRRRPALDTGPACRGRSGSPSGQSPSPRHMSRHAPSTQTRGDRGSPRARHRRLGLDTRTTRVAGLRARGRCSRRRRRRAGAGADRPAPAVRMPPLDPRRNRRPTRRTPPPPFAPPVDPPTAPVAAGPRVLCLGVDARRHLEPPPPLPSLPPHAAARCRDREARRPRELVQRLRITGSPRRAGSCWCRRWASRRDTRSWCWDPGGRPGRRRCDSPRPGRG
jgi:hypothetical protein